MTYTAAVCPQTASRVIRRFPILLCLWLLGIASHGHGAVLITSAELHTHPHSLSDVRRTGDRPVVQLTALGRDITIALEPSPLLSRWPEALLPADTPQLFHGIVNGEARNWARISIDQGLLSGHLWMEERLWRLQHRSRLPTLPAATGPLPEGDWLLYDTMALAALDGVADRIALPPVADTLDRRNTYRNTASLTPGKINRALRLGIVIDSRFDAYHGFRGLAEALDIVNGVDGLYQAQLGVAVVVEAIRLFDDPDTDPLNRPDAAVEDLLQRFRTIRLAEPALSGELSLVHLFSGNEDPSRVIGLGWIDTVCRLDGYDVSLSTPFAFSTLLAAHEIAHNLGALHDEDPTCASLTASHRHIMGSRLSGSSVPEFSACSLRDMAPAVSAQCLVDNIDLSIALRASQTGTERLRQVQVEVANLDATRAAPDIGSRTEFPIGTILDRAPAGCRIEDNLLQCRHGTIAAGARSAVTVLATLPSLDSQPVVATLEIDSLVDINDTDNRAGLDVMLQAESALSPEPLAVGDDATGDPTGDVPGDSPTDGVPSLAAGTGRPVLALLGLLLAYALYRMNRQRLERQTMRIARQGCQGFNGL